MSGKRRMAYGIILLATGAISIGLSAFAPDPVTAGAGIMSAWAALGGVVVAIHFGRVGLRHQRQDRGNSTRLTANRLVAKVEALARDVHDCRLQLASLSSNLARAKILQIKFQGAISDEPLSFAKDDLADLDSATGERLAKSVGELQQIAPRFRTDTLENLAELVVNQRFLQRFFFIDDELQAVLAALQRHTRTHDTH